MSTIAKTKRDSNVLAVADLSRMPQQGRSVASLRRMLEATRDLMLERGNEDFTLLEVTERGQVSIGSIYRRFESKDNLVRGVIAEALEALAADETRMVERLRDRCSDLRSFIFSYVEGYAELLRKHAPMLRLIMDRAEFDPQVAVPGREHALLMERTMCEALLVHAEEFGGSDAEDHVYRAHICFHVIFSTLARQLSLGSNDEAVHGHDWDRMKREMARLSLAYLRSE